MEIFPTPQAIHRQPVTGWFGWLSRLTVADGLLGLVLLAAAVLRLANLGHLPLSMLKRRRRWRCGSSGSRVRPFWLPISPAYFSLTAWLTQLFGFGDGMMRAGTGPVWRGLVYLPWLLRHRLGTQGALVTAVLLAISPLNSTVARTAGGDSMALFALLLLLVAWVRWQDSGDGRWAYALAAAVGLGFASAPLFYSGLVSLALAWVLQMTLGPRLIHQAEAREGETAVWPKAAVVGLLIFLALSTTFLLNISGIGAAASLFADWLQQFGRSAIAPVTTPFLAVARYEPALLLVGFAAIFWISWSKHALGRLAFYWLVGVLGRHAGAARGPSAMRR
jgi:hypothetical protein